MEEKDGQAAENSEYDSNFNKFVIKEILDRVGFGFASQQFINVLLFLSGAGIFFVGIVNGLRAIVGMIAGILLEEYNKTSMIGKKAVGLGGIVFGFSFLLMSAGRFLSSPLIFSLAIILGGISLAVYGFSQNIFGVGKKRNILEKIAKYGLMVTALSLLISAFVMDKYGPDTAFLVSLFGKLAVIKMPGYLISFEIAAVSFIVSGYFLASAKPGGIRAQETPQNLFFSSFKQSLGSILQNRMLVALAIFSIISGILQVVGNSFYGIFIYQNFNETNFGGFMNVAVVFLIGIFSSLVGYFITKLNTKEYNPIFMLFIGGLFLSLMPFAYYKNFNSLAILTAGTIFGIIGSSAMAISTNMIVINSLSEEHRKNYYLLNGLISVIPYLIFVPVLSYIGQMFQLRFLFLILGGFMLLSTFSIFIFYLFSRKQNINY
ncbi:MAG: hypothetical protein AABX32_02905 [Nanoarchaeota archaeon]